MACVKIVKLLGIIIIIVNASAQIVFTTIIQWLVFHVGTYISYEARAENLNIISRVALNA